MAKEQKKVPDKQTLSSQPGRKKEFVNPEFGLDTQNKLSITSYVEPGTRVVQVGLDAKNDFSFFPGGMNNLFGNAFGFFNNWGGDQRDKINDPNPGKVKIKQEPAGKRFNVPRQNALAQNANMAPQHMASLGSNGAVNQCDPLRYT